MSSVPATLRDPRSEVTQATLPSPWPLGRLAPFTCVNACGKRRALRRSTDSPVTNAGLQHHGLLESELDEPDQSLAISFS